MWKDGIINGYLFSIKVFEEPSEYGINEGRISKLEISKTGKILCSYDRGWDIRPEGEEVKAVYQEILKRFN